MAFPYFSSPPVGFRCDPHQRHHPTEHENPEHPGDHPPFHEFLRSMILMARTMQVPQIGTGRTNAGSIIGVAWLAPQIQQFIVSSFSV